MQSEYVMDALDSKLNEAFDGKVVRKDLLHRIKKGTNLPTFVLESCSRAIAPATTRRRSRRAWRRFSRPYKRTMSAPTRPTPPSHAWRSREKHKFIDKVHVRYVEKEKRRWASLENFASQRIAIGEKFYRDNDRLLEGASGRRSSSPTTTSTPTLTPSTSRTCARFSSPASTSLPTASQEDIHPQRVDRRSPTVRRP